MIKGYQNEYNFCDILNDKFAYQLDEKFVCFLENIYERKLEPKAYIICWKPNKTDKADIVIRVGNEKKYISIKTGKNNSIHLESLSTFLKFLNEINCPEELIAIYKNYHYGNDNYGNRMSGKSYQERFSKDLTKLNVFLNKKENVEKAISRFLFCGINKNYGFIDAVIYGTPEKFYYATSKQIINYLLHSNDIFLSPHFSSLVLQPWTRNLNYNPKYEYRRDFVQVKWYRLDVVFEMIHDF